MSGWTVVVPAKPWHLAKSRLRLPGRDRIARAMTLDTLEAVSAARGVARVVVVSAERGLIVPSRRLGAAVVPDRPLLTREGMNTAIDLGRRWAVCRFPRDPVVVVPADLPCLDAETLAETLDLLARHDRAFVPDLEQGGTTLLTAESPKVLRCAFGAESGLRHERLGLHRLDASPVRARADVDTVDDLTHALTLGVGVHTRGAAVEATTPTHAGGMHRAGVR